MKTRYIFILSCLVLLFGLYRLMHNRDMAVQQTQAIIAADAASQDTKAAIETLQNYVHAHMRASVNFTLAGSYSRALQAAQTQQANGQVYTAAQANCASRANSIRQAQCVTAYVAAHSTLGQVSQPVLPEEKNYQHSFNSPAWSPDLAGISLLIGSLGSIGSLLLAGMQRRHPTNRF